MTELQPDPPTIVGGRYRLTRKLARGGMAQVYLGHDEVLDRAVAVKMLFTKFADDERFVARFRREASAAANLNHANIVQVFDWHAEGDSYFIVMEFVPGRDLASLLQQGPLDLDRAVAVGAAGAAALECAHRAGILHRDIKPGNILVTDDGTAKVADFGVARAFDSTEKLTETGRVMGTAAYFSPEQAQGKQLGPPSDLYSLGAVLFEMVTGSPLFAGSSPVDVAYKQVHDRPRRARAVNPDVPPDLDAVIDRLLAKNPNDRYATADELVAELEQVAHHLRHPELLAAVDGGPADATSALPQAGPATAVMASPVGPGIAPRTPIPAAGTTSGAGVEIEQAGDRGNWLVLAVAAVLVLVVVGLLWLSTVIDDDSAETTSSTGSAPAELPSPADTEPAASEPVAPTLQQDADGGADSSGPDPSPATSAETTTTAAETTSTTEATTTTASSPTSAPAEPETTTSAP